jgi:hypothetical protein
VRGNSHAPCGAGKKLEITSDAYLLLTIVNPVPNTSLAGEVIGYLLGYIDGKHELTGLTEKQMSDFHKSLSNRGLTISGIKQRQY